MRKAFAGGLAAVAFAATAIMVAPSAWAQARDRAFTPGFGPLLMPPGSQIGVSVHELRSDEISSAALQSGGVYVAEVRPGSPGSAAGFKTGDIITEFDGERVRGVRHFSRLIAETPQGRTVKATVIRAGRSETLSVTPEAGGQAVIAVPDLDREIQRGLRSLPRNFDFDLRLPQPETFNQRGRLGVTLLPLTGQLASYFGVESGVLVSEVMADSPAAQSGLKAGDVIVAVGSRSVKNPSDVTAQIREATPGMPVDVRIVRDKKEMTLKTTIPERRQRVRERGVPL